MMTIIFFVGVFVGVMVGFLAMGLCRMAKEAEKGEEMHYFRFAQLDSGQITPLAERTE